MNRGRVLGLACALVLVVVVVVVVLSSGGDGGDGGDDEQEAATTTEAPNRPPTVEELPSSSTTAVPTSSVPEEGVAAADEIIAAAGPDLALTPPQLECLANRLAGDPDLREQAGSDPTPGSEGFGVLVEEGERCVLVVDVAPAFVTTIEPSLEGDLTDEDRRCLAEAYVDLTEEQRQAIVGAGLEPEADGAAAGRAVLDDLLASCDLARVA